MTTGTSGSFPTGTALNDSTTVTNYEGTGYYTGWWYPYPQHYWYPYHSPHKACDCCRYCGEKPDKKAKPKKACDCCVHCGKSQKLAHQTISITSGTTTIANYDTCNVG